MEFILLHGSFHTGDVWNKVGRLLEESGFEVQAPTLSGNEINKNHRSRTITLSSHIQEVISLIEEKPDNKPVLVGHSYAGMILTGTADRISSKLGKLVFLDAFIPADGQSLFDIAGKDWENRMRTILVDESGKNLDEGAARPCYVPPRSAHFYLGPDANRETAANLEAHLVSEPLGTFSEKLNLQNKNPFINLDCSFIRCTRFPAMAGMEQKAQEAGFDMYSIKAGHDVMLTNPEELSRLLIRISGNS
ncbi:MAG: alpha/beta fold hydrolase [Anaerolineales bacterium]|nr:alpha/beta fold hydrolase [Anaerolineales bacterium]